MQWDTATCLGAVAPSTATGFMGIQHEFLTLEELLEVFG